MSGSFVMRHPWRGSSRPGRRQYAHWRVLLLVCTSFVALRAPGAHAQSQTAQVPPQTDPPQTAAGQTQPLNTLAEVVVTGSHVATSMRSAASPVSEISAENLAASGSTHIEDALNQMPEVDAAQGSATGFDATGTATLNLRGLGDTRTLVLVNGNRLMPGDPTDVGADLNNIPQQLVERVDIVTGGASAVYGSDAIAGVVNFILKQNFQGLEIDGEGGVYQHDEHETQFYPVFEASRQSFPTGSTWDGGQRTISITGGRNFDDDRGNITAYVNYRDVSPVSQGERDFGSCPLQRAGALTSDAIACTGGSQSNPPRLVLISATNPGATAAVGGEGYTVAGSGAAATLVPWNPLTDHSNYTITNDYQREDKNILSGFMAHYRFNEHAEVHAEFSYMDDSTYELTSPLGIGYGPNFTIPCTYPYLTSGELGAFCGGATTGSFTARVGYGAYEMGQQFTQFLHKSYRGVGGLRGTIDDAWKYDLSFQYGRTNVTEEGKGSSYSGQANILSDCTLNPDDGCVPYDLFQNAGGGPAGAEAYLTVPFEIYGDTTQEVVNATFNGDLGKYGVKSPWADESVAVALGTEYREEGLATGANAETLSGNSNYGTPYVPISGSYNVKEFFSEIRIPLIAGKPFVNDLNVDIPYRYSNYSLAGATNTYAFEVNYSPVREFRLRGSFQRAVRAPNVIELFTPVSISSASYTDPCAGTTPTFTLAQCERTGMTAAEYGSALNEAPAANDNNVLAGGSQSLKPEVATTFSYGAVMEPAFIPRLRLSADYYNINVQHVIQEGATSGGQIITNCALTASSYFCGLIHRDGSGSVGLTPEGYVLGTYVNAGALKVSGIDVTGNYSVPLDRFGHLAFDLDGTRLLHLAHQPIPGGAQYDCAGYYGQICGVAPQGAPNPVWRSTLRATWNTPYHDLSISTRWEYYGATKVDLSSPNPALAAPYWPVDAHQQSVSYFDVSAALPINEAVLLRAGVNNILDQDPPYYSLTGGNSYYQYYDALGRYLFVQISAKF